METADIHTTLVEGYFQLLDKLTPDNKLDLISKLSESVKTDFSKRKSSFKKSFGAFVSEKTAEEIINDIRSSRAFNRQIEEF